MTHIVKITNYTCDPCKEQGDEIYTCKLMNVVKDGTCSFAGFLRKSLRYV